ncbi:serine hydrolase [Streptomyces sp. NPDC055078]
MTTMETQRKVLTTISEAAAAVGVRVWLHAVDIDSGRSLSIDGDAPVVTASVFKVPVAVELARQAAAGEVDLAERITVSPEGAAPSPYGLATFRHESTLSLHDLAMLMIGISDNVATDLVMDRTGREPIAKLLAGLGLQHTAVPQNCAELLADICEDLGIVYEDDERALAALPLEKVMGIRALKPEHTCRTTAAEMTRLLSLVWQDKAAPPQACADVRNWMGRQVWPHRLRSGFTGDGIRVSGKTGTLPSVRNEVGVVEYPDGGRYAVGVFTQSTDIRSQVPARDAFIGFAAARAVEWLRSRELAAER